MRQYTYLAIFLAIVLLALFYWWFQPNWIVLLAYSLVSVLAVASVLLLYHWLGYNAQDEVSELAALEAKEHTDLLARLQGIRQELQTLKLTQGVQQADNLTHIIDDYHAVVNARFFGKKYSPLTYHSAARQVQQHAIQNLNDMVAIGHSMSTITRQGAASEDARLYQEQQQRLNQLLQENEQLFDALTKTAVEVANIRSFNDFERTDTLARLVALSRIANTTGQ